MGLDELEVGLEDLHSVESLSTGEVRFGVFGFPLSEGVLDVHWWEFVSWKGGNNQVETGLSGGGGTEAGIDDTDDGDDTNGGKNQRLLVRWGWGKGDEW